MDGGMDSRPRLHEGRLYAGIMGWGGTRQRDSSTPLRCARNDMWVAGIAEKSEAGQNGGMGPRIHEDRGGCAPIPRLHEGRL